MNFDQLIDRQKSESIKWRLYEQDVLPMWLADMDFLSPEPVIKALRDRVDHGVFGYGGPPEGLEEAITKHLLDFQGWTIHPGDINFVCGVVTGFAHAIYSLTEPGDRILIQTPVYPPILKAASSTGRQSVHNPLILKEDGSYEINFDDFEQKAASGVKLFILCNPHNPVGRVFTREELTKMADICLAHDIKICSDEIHGDLVFTGCHHTPIASLSAKIADSTVTYFAPSKTYNIAGLSTSVFVAQNPELKEQLTNTFPMLLGHPNILGLHAALAAYRDSRDWLKEVLVYLEANRDYMVNFISNELTGIKVWKPEGTFLGWLDCRALGLESPYKFFLEEAKVGFNDGVAFGGNGEGFLRFNFACPREILNAGLNRMKTALNE